MPELRNRNRIEQQTAIALARVADRQRARLEQTVATTPASEIDQAFWRRIQRETFAAILILLLPVYESAAGQLSPDVVTNRREAEKWAVDHAEAMAEQLTNGTRERFMELAEQAQNSAELSAGLGVILGPRRAAGIAVTEITTATSAGQGGAAERELADGRVLVPIWNAMREGTCPVCRRLDGKGFEVYGDNFPNGPPAHPNCRCWIDYEER